MREVSALVLDRLREYDAAVEREEPRTDHIEGEHGRESGVRSLSALVGRSCFGKFLHPIPASARMVMGDVLVGRGRGELGYCALGDGCPSDT